MNDGHSSPQLVTLTTPISHIWQPPFDGFSMDLASKRHVEESEPTSHKDTWEANQNPAVFLRGKRTKRTGSGPRDATSEQRLFRRSLHARVVEVIHHRVPPSLRFAAGSTRSLWRGEGHGCGRGGGDPRCTSSFSPSPFVVCRQQRSPCPRRTAFEAAASLA